MPVGPFWFHFHINFCYFCCCYFYHYDECKYMRKRKMFTFCPILTAATLLAVYISGDVSHRHYLFHPSIPHFHFLLEAKLDVCVCSWSSVDDGEQNKNGRKLVSQSFKPATRYALASNLFKLAPGSDPTTTTMWYCRIQHFDYPSHSYSYQL